MTRPPSVGMVVATAAVLVAGCGAGDQGPSSRRCEEKAASGFGQLAATPRASEGWKLLPKSPLGGRGGHAAVWTGKEMIVWGGVAPENEEKGRLFDDGAAYEPRTRRWREVAESPLDATGDVAVVWTGDEAVFWGRTGGGAYRPAEDCWRSLPRSPLSRRHSHSAVWTGKEVIVWGGGAGIEEEGPSGEPPIFADGAAYDPAAREWRSLSDSPLPPRLGHTAVWTGREMIVWGGYGERDALFSDGASYNPTTDTWADLPPAPLAGRVAHSAVWTGKEMILWGGNDLDTLTPTGAAYDPVARHWSQLPPAPIPAISEMAVWTGDEMMVWGATVTDRAVGAAYSPARDSWRRLPHSPLEGRAGQSALWTSEEMIVWGGFQSRRFENFDDGAAYRPGR